MLLLMISKENCMALVLPLLESAKGFPEVIISLFQSRLQVNPYNIESVEIISSFCLCRSYASTVSKMLPWPLTTVQHVQNVFSSPELGKHRESVAPSHREQVGLPFFPVALHKCVVCNSGLNSATLSLNISPCHIFK